MGKGSHTVTHVTLKGWLLACSYFNKQYVMTYHGQAFRGSSKKAVIAQVEQAMEDETDGRYVHRIDTGYWP